MKIIHFNASDPSTYRVNKHGNVDIYYAPKETVLHNSNLKYMTPKELQITAPEGWEIDREKSTLDKIIFKEVKEKYPMDLGISLQTVDFHDKLNLFGRLVLTCREWNRIDGFENDANNIKQAIILDYKTVCVSGFSSNNRAIAFKDYQTAEKFLSTFKKELEEVKEFL